jgi:hypothetical protein
MRFSAGLERSRAKAQSLAMKRFFRWTEEAAEKVIK